jgi:hypothetical protein
MLLSLVVAVVSLIMVQGNLLVLARVAIVRQWLVKTLVVGFRLKQNSP